MGQMSMRKINMVKCVKKKNREKWFPNKYECSNIIYHTLFFKLTLWTLFCTLGSTAMHLAAGRGHLETVKWLVENGADVNKENDKSKNKF